MTPILRHWKEEESAIPMMRSCDISELCQAKEYRVSIKTSIGHFDRFVCQVELNNYDGPNLSAWADTTTGTFYTTDGRCLSGPLAFASKPVKTGRDVPTLAKRQKEGEQRVASW